jgi:hypothetical protein
VSLRNCPLHTIEYSSPEDFRPAANSVYVYGAREEERTHHVEEWSAGGIPDVDVIRVDEAGRDSVKLDDGETISLRNRDDVISALTRGDRTNLYLDITGLSNHIWPAFLKVASEISLSVHVVYVEPLDYTYSAQPRENVIFDLSERILGISPIAQFTNLSEPEDDATSLVPLLGFEGARLQHLIEEIQPPGNNIDPVIGVPGFRAEYPFFAYQGNQVALRTSGAYRKVRYAKANCPFSAFYALSDIQQSYPIDQFLKIGLIGTKPHALGAVLFALASPIKVELVYDHTIRRPQRSTGHSHCFVYPVTKFLEFMAAL